MYTRPFPGLALATTALIGSTAGGQLLVASNSTRADLRIQPLGDAFTIGPAPSMSGSYGLFVASGAILSVSNHLGALYALPGAGATAAIAVWEASQ